MDMESFNMLIMINIKVIGKMDKDLDKDYINMLMETHIMDNG